MGNKRRGKLCLSRTDPRTTSGLRNDKKSSNSGQTTATATTKTTGKTTTTTTTKIAESTTTTTPKSSVDCRKRQCHHASPKLAMVFPFLTNVANLGNAKIFMISCFDLHCCFRKTQRSLWNHKCAIIDTYRYKYDIVMSSHQIVFIKQITLPAQW